MARRRNAIPDCAIVPDLAYRKALELKAAKADGPNTKQFFRFVKIVVAVIAVVSLNPHSL